MWNDHFSRAKNGHHEFEDSSSDDTGSKVGCTSPDDISSTITDAFTVVESRPEYLWARDFVLDTSSETNIQVLSNPAALPYACTLSFSDICFQADEINGTFDYRLEVDVLFVPSFCSGNLSVGAVVSRSVSKPVFDCRFDSEPASSKDGDLHSEKHISGPPLNDSPYTYRIGRYARDETSGKMLVILHSHSVLTRSPLQTQVISLAHISPMRNKRVVISCDTETFLAGRIVESVTLCMTKIFDRDCPVCFAPARTTCGCSMGHSRPTHPFDFRGAIAAVKLQAGELSASSSHAKVFALHLKDIPPVLLLKNSLKPTEEIAPHKFDPRLDSHDQVSRKFITLPVVTRSRIVCDFPSRSNDERRIRFDSLSSVLHQFAVQFSLSSAHPLQLVGPRLDPDRTTAYPSVETKISCDGVLELELSLTDQGIPTSVCGESSLINEDTMCQNPPDCTNTRHRPPVELEAETSANTIKTTVNVVESGSCAEASGLYSKTLPDSALTPKASVKGFEVSSSAVSRVEHEKPVLNRHAIRRLKNRASAARSNAKRKALNDELKQNVICVRARLKELRDRQASLLEENLALRSQLQNSPCFVGFLYHGHR